MRVEGSNLSMVRGDSESITVKIKDSLGEKINFGIGDTIYFTVKLNTTTDQKVIQKIVTAFDDGNAVIEINSLDTQDLNFRSYRYDIQWVNIDGRVSTIIPASMFTILPEVTTTK